MLSKSCVVLQALGEHYKFECVVGLNGCVWITSPSLMNTIVVRNLILASEYMDPQTVRDMVNEATHL